MSDALSTSASEFIAHRRAAFAAFLSERYPVLEDLFSTLGFATPESVRSAAHVLIAPFDTWVKNQSVPETDRVWLSARLGYFIGEVFAQKYGGHWLLCEDPSRHSFGRYVVGGFAAPDTGYLVDAFEAANTLASQPAPRSLAAVIAGIDGELLCFQH